MVSQTDRSPRHSPRASSCKQDRQTGAHIQHRQTRQLRPNLSHLVVPRDADLGPSPSRYHLAKPPQITQSTDPVLIMLPNRQHTPALVTTIRIQHTACRTSLLAAFLAVSEQSFIAMGGQLLSLAPQIPHRRAPALPSLLIAPTCNSNDPAATVRNCGAADYVALFGPGLDFRRCYLRRLVINSLAPKPCGQAWRMSSTPFGEERAAPLRHHSQTMTFRLHGSSASITLTTMMPLSLLVYVLHCVLAYYHALLALSESVCRSAIRSSAAGTETYAGLIHTRAASSHTRTPNLPSTSSRLASVQQLLIHQCSRLGNRWLAALHREASSTRPLPQS